MRARKVAIVRGFGGWYIRRLCVHLLQEHRYIGAYTSSGRASAAARKRGYTVVSVEV